MKILLLHDVQADKQNGVSVSDAVSSFANFMTESTSC